MDIEEKIVVLEKQIQELQETLVAIQKKLGIDDSTDETSVDYKLNKLAKRVEDLSVPRWVGSSGDAK
jgi:hypothetical protein